jgi:hypothetical protein
MKNASRVFLGLLMAVVPCAAESASAKPTLVEFSHVGNDALSKTLADKVETAFKQSPDFILTSERKPGTLVVTIPTNVGWKRVGERTEVLYRVRFASADNKIISKATGSCWFDSLANCTDQILRDTKIAARKLR